MVHLLVEQVCYDDTLLRERVSRVARAFLLGMPSSATPAERIGPRRSCARSMPAFPKPRQGRPPHRVFRGLKMFILITACRFARRPDAATCLPGSDGFVTSAAAGIVSRPERPLPGRDLHPLEHSTLARRTWATTPPTSCLDRQYPNA